MPTVHSKPFTGLQRKAESTQKNHDQGRIKWNAFAILQTVKQLEDWTLADVDIDGGDEFQATFEEFASFLLHFTKSDGTHYACDSKLQTLSNARNAFDKHFRTLDKNRDIFREGSQMAEWYSGLRVSV
jgi:hypothetical protein